MDPQDTRMLASPIIPFLPGPSARVKLTQAGSTPAQYEISRPV